MERQRKPLAVVGALLLAAAGLVLGVLAAFAVQTVTSQRGELAPEPSSVTASIEADAHDDSPQGLGNIEGRVRFPDGRVPRGEGLSAFDTGREVRMMRIGADGSAERLVEWDATGSFCANALPIGAYQITVSFTDKAALVDVHSGTTAHCELVVPQWPVVRGRVLAADGPVASARVEAVDVGSRAAKTRASSFDFYVPGTTADDRGEFALEIAFPGDYVVWATTPAGALSEDSVLGVAYGQQSTLDLRFASGRISGRVIDERSGEPIPGARVQDLFDGHPFLGSGILADAQGTFELRDLQPGKHVLLVAADGHKFLRHELVTTKGLDAHSLDLRLERAASVTGFVLDANGRAATEPLTASLCREQPTGWSQPAWAEVVDGRFVFDHLDGGRVRVEMKPKWKPGSMMPATQVDHSASASVTIDLEEAQAATIVIRLPSTR